MSVVLFLRSWSQRGQRRGKNKANRLPICLEPREERELPAEGGLPAQSGQWWASLYNVTSFTTVLLATWSPAVTWTDVSVGDLTGNGQAAIVGRVAQTGQWWATVSTPNATQTSLWDSWSPSVPW